MAIDLMPGFGAFAASNSNPTWDPGKLGTGIVLSDGNRSALNSTGFVWRTFLGQSGKSTGKWCIAYEMTTWTGADANTVAFGVCKDPGSYNGNPWGLSTSSCTVRLDGNVYSDLVGFTVGVSQSVGVTTTGQWVAFYFDFGDGKVWQQDEVTSFQNSQDPATGANPRFTFTPGETYFPVGAIDSDRGFVVRILTGTDFPTTVPSGFTVW